MDGQYHFVGSVLSQENLFFKICLNLNTETNVMAIKVS